MRENRATDDKSQWVSYYPQVGSPSIFVHRLGLYILLISMQHLYFYCHKNTISDSQAKPTTTYRKQEFKLRRREFTQKYVSVNLPLTAFVYTKGLTSQVRID